MDGELIDEEFCLQGGSRGRLFGDKLRGFQVDVVAKLIKRLHNILLV